MTRTRRFVSLAIAMVAGLAIATTATAAPNKCSSGKTKLAGKKAAAILNCYSKASKKGVPIDPLCVFKAQSKFQLGSQKIDGKQDITKPETLCPAGSGDEGLVEVIVDQHVDDVADDLDPGFPNLALSTCTAGKIKCAGKKDSAKLKCHSKALKKDLPVDPLCLQKAETKFTTCYLKLEGKQDPMQPESVCVQPDGDAPAIEAKIDAFVAQIVAHYTNAPGSCPTEIKYTVTSTNGILDYGWTGQGHDNPVISDATVKLAVTSCSGSPPNCGVCSYSGPIPNDPGDIQSRRCRGDSSIQCTNDAMCGVNAPCLFFYGSYLPTAAGGVSTCLQNTFNGPISGTMDMSNGQRAESVNVVTRIFSGPALSFPCPNCNGDATANDGITGGICSGGARNGLACDASGSSPNISWGTTSLDCPPIPGGLIASLPVDISNTTGTMTRTLSAASPNCRAIGQTAKKCQCDTCNNAAGTICSSNADCIAVGATVCGGRRCLSGPNFGAPCAVSSECPSSVCGILGQATSPNQCDDFVCSPDPGTPSPNDGTCAAGPFETFCGPAEPYRGCISNADCSYPGDTCSIGKDRDCFDSGGVGGSVVATGQADPPVGHQADPTLGSLFCLGPTSAGAVNAANGLPGLGRLELEQHVVDNGTP